MSLFLQTDDIGLPQKTISAYSQQREVDYEPDIISFGWDLAGLDERELRPSSEEEKRRNGEQRKRRNGGTARVTSSETRKRRLGRDDGRITPDSSQKPSEMRVSMPVVAVAVSSVSVSSPTVS